MITDEDYRALQINCQRMEREMKAMRQTLLDDFAKAALIAVIFRPEKPCSPEHYAKWCYDAAEAAVAEREKRYGTR